VGVGEATCDDGQLYLTLLLRDGPTMPASGRYSSRVYAAGQITEATGLVYGTAVDHQGRTVDLLLDVYSPPYSPTVGDRPLVVLIHGGGFVGGTRTDLRPAAVEYARRGYVAASIDYRLRPHDDEQQQVVAAVQAIDDGMESVRWLRANAATYHIDTGRIAALGTSAGGGIALGIGEATDPTPGGPLAAQSPKVDAVMSTGAALTSGLDLVGFEPTDAPAMMFYFEQDTSKYGHTWDWAYETCTAIRDAGNSCDFIKQAGSGHTISLNPTGPWWSPEIGPFLWHHLGLAP
jgi:acetyl esterase/lipase